MNDRDRQRNHILTALAVEWDKRPELRFGQLVENLIKPDIGPNQDVEDHWEHCIFHVTDDSTLARVLEGLP